MSEGSAEFNRNETRANLEVIAPTVEEAIEKGLSDLGLSEEAVEVEILDEGSRGLLGLGSRQARVRLTIKSADGVVDIPTAPQEVESVMKETDAVAEVEDVDEAAGPVVDVEGETAAPTTAERERAQIALHIARETVVDLLERMKVTADVDAYYAEPDDAHSRSALWVDVSGSDLSILIGHHAETLNALQYITSLIVGKELGRSLPLVVDVQGYRKRRAQEVRRVARQMADQAVKTGRRQILEPMTPSERRLVHIELRKNPEVTTESIGEGERRKVTVIPVFLEE